MYPTRREVGKSPSSEKYLWSRSPRVFLLAVQGHEDWPAVGADRGAPADADRAAAVRLEPRRDRAVRRRQPGPAAVLPARDGAPDDTTLPRWASLIRPATFDARLDQLVALARELKVTRGRKLRVIPTVRRPHAAHRPRTGLDPPSRGSHRERERTLSIAGSTTTALLTVGAGPPRGL